jgi:hypothetical protein
MTHSGPELQGSPPHQAGGPTARCAPAARHRRGRSAAITGAAPNPRVTIPPATFRSRHPAPVLTPRGMPSAVCPTPDLKATAKPGATPKAERNPKPKPPQAERSHQGQPSTQAERNRHDNSPRAERHRQAGRLDASAWMDRLRSPVSSTMPRPATGDRRPATGDRRPATGDRRPATGDRRPVAPSPIRLGGKGERVATGPRRGARAPGAVVGHHPPCRPIKLGLLSAAVVSYLHVAVRTIRRSIVAT